MRRTSLHQRYMSDSRDEVWHELRQRQDEDDDEDNDGPFVLDVAPDALHKADISGGAPYGFLVPDVGVDGMFRYDDGVLIPFVEYLRLTFSSGAFPGLRNDHGPAVWRFRTKLAEGLLRL